MYAAKVLNRNEYDQETIDQEISLRIKLNHSTINNFFGFINNDPKSVFLVMQKSTNGSLMDVFENKLSMSSGHPFDNTARQIVLVGIAYGMVFLHKNFIFHHSLTPECILLDKNFYPFITDIEFEKPSSQSIKFPIYIAPEYLKNKEFNGKSDVYSFGIIMYQIITNTDPFPQVLSGQMTEHEFIFNIIYNDLRPEIPSEINLSFSTLLSKCWSKDPMERPSFQEIYQKLYYDFNYHLDDVDTIKLFRYVSKIEIEPQKENSKRKITKTMPKSSDTKVNKAKIHSSS